MQNIAQNIASDKLQIQNRETDSKLEGELKGRWTRRRLKTQKGGSQIDSNSQNDGFSLSDGENAEIIQAAAQDIADKRNL